MIFLTFGTGMGAGLILDGRLYSGTLGMAGEVGLSGEIRPVTRIAQRIAEAEKLGFKRMLVPAGSVKGLEQQPQNMELVPVARVEEALRQLFG